MHKVSFPPDLRLNPSLAAAGAFLDEAALTHCRRFYLPHILTRSRHTYSNGAVSQILLDNSN